MVNVPKVYIAIQQSYVIQQSEVYFCPNNRTVLNSKKFYGASVFKTNYHEIKVQFPRYSYISNTQ